MLKQKSPCAIVTFPNTTSALAMEAACKECALPGRIIPVPNQIYAGCGFAWRADASEKQRLEDFLKEKNLIYSEIHSLEL